MILVMGVDVSEKDPFMTQMSCNWQTVFQTIIKLLFFFSLFDRGRVS